MQLNAQVQILLFLSLNFLGFLSENFRAFWLPGKPV